MVLSSGTLDLLCRTLLNLKTFGLTPEFLTSVSSKKTSLSSNQFPQSENKASLLCKEALFAIKRSLVWSANKASFPGRYKSLILL